MEQLEKFYPNLICTQTLGHVRIVLHIYLLFVLVLLILGYNLFYSTCFGEFTLLLSYDIFFMPKSKLCINCNAEMFLNCRWQLLPNVFINNQWLLNRYANYFHNDG